VQGDPLQELADQVGCGRDGLTVVYVVPDAACSGFATTLVTDRGWGWTPATAAAATTPQQEGEGEKGDGGDGDDHDPDDDDHDPPSPCSILHVTLYNPNHVYTDGESYSTHRRKRPFVFL
jgi:hypothetical protein